MSTIAYDPVKDGFASWIKNNRFLRTQFYRLLNLFFLRSWHIRRVIRKLYKTDLADKNVVNILDAGCGFGQYDRFLLNSFPKARISSVDIKEDYLQANRHYFKNAIEHNLISFYEVDLLEFNESPQYDFALCVDVLEHIEDDVKVIKNISRSLNIGGFFLMHSPSHYAEEDAGGDDSFVGEHARAGYSKADISEKLKQAGLTPVKVHYTYGFFGHLAWVLLIKWPMLYLTKTGHWGSLLLPFYYIPLLTFGLLFMILDLFTKNEKGTGIYALAVKT